MSVPENPPANQSQAGGETQPVESQGNASTSANVDSRYDELSSRLGTIETNLNGKVDGILSWLTTNLSPAQANQNQETVADTVSETLVESSEIVVEDQTLPPTMQTRKTNRVRFSLATLLGQHQ